MCSHLRLRILSVGLIVVSVSCHGATTGSPTEPTLEEQPTDDPSPPPSPAPGPRWSLRFARYLAFGDSLTSGMTSPNAINLAAGLGDEYWSMLNTLLQEQYPDQLITISGAGEPGEWALNGVNRLPLVLAADPPEVLLLMEGVNDLNFFGDSGVQAAVRAIERMIGTARAAGIEVIVATLPPERPGGSRAWAPSAVVAFNALLRDRVPQAGAVLADVYEAMAQDLSLIGPDGLHPTHEGYRLIADVFYETIRRQYEEERPAVTWSPAGRSTH